MTNSQFYCHSDNNGRNVIYLFFCILHIYQKTSFPIVMDYCQGLKEYASAGKH